MAHRVTIPRTSKKNRFDLLARALENAKFDMEFYTRSTRAASSAISLHGEGWSKMNHDKMLGMHATLTIKDELKNFKITDVGYS